MALGAEPRDVIWLFLKNGVILAVIGAATGSIASWFLIKMLAQMVPAVPGISPWVIASVGALLVVVAVIASWLPARRTTEVNPVIALGAE